MNVEILAPAQADIKEMVQYYESQRRGLGLEFLKEVEEAIDRIVHHPQAWQPLSGGSRRCQTRRFPYGIGYRVRGDTIEIAAVMHLRRDPRTWRSRLEGEPT